MPNQFGVPSPSRHIRPLVTDDLDAVVQLALLAWEPVFVSWEHIVGVRIFHQLYRPSWQAAQADQVRTNCRATGAESYVCTSAGDVVGFLVLERQGEDGRVQMIAVHPAHHRRGHARALMEFAVSRLREQGVPLLNVGTGGDPGHAPARGLYEALGFTGVPLVAYYLLPE